MIQMLCQCLERLWTKYAQSEEVALIQRNPIDWERVSDGLREDEEKRTQVSYAQLYQWHQQLRVALEEEENDGRWLVVGINVTPFSIEETAAMLLVAEQSHWVYVPVDVLLPLARQLQALQSAGVRRLVTTADSPLAKFFAEDGGGVESDLRRTRRVVESKTVASTSSPFRPVQVAAFPSNFFLTETKESALECRRRRLDVEMEDQDLVAPLYVLFTSGTTGEPRGVLGTRTGAWTRLEWMWTTYPFARSEAGDGTIERVLRATKLSFVDSVWEILGAFLQRVPLVHLQSPRRQIEGSGRSYMTSVVLDNSVLFLEVIRSENVTRFIAVPSVLEVLLLQTTEIDRQTGLAGLRYVLSSGEALSLQVVQQLTASLPDVTVLNLYGSTEVSGDVTCMELKAPLSSAQIAEWQQHGVPIATLDRYGVVGGSTSLVLLSADLEKSTLHSSDISAPTVIWPRRNASESISSTEIDKQPTTGILYVSGPLLTFGYIGDGHEDVFVGSDSLLSGQNDSKWARFVQPSRWFCTGDICSVIQGHLYFRGRKDNAVKIHGQRVYLEAVECAVAAALKEMRKDTRYDDSHQVIAFTTTKEVSKYELLQRRIVVCIIRDDVSNAPVARYSQPKTLNAWITKHYGTSHIPHEVLLVPTNAVPRLANGKIDRRTLKFNYDTGDCNVPLPSTSIDDEVKSSTEKLMARLLKEILDIPLSDGISDDIRPRTFREAGGNSLLASLFVHELRKEFDALSLTAQELLEMNIGEVLSTLREEPTKNILQRPVKPTNRTPKVVSEGASSTASGLKRRKKAHPALSGESTDDGGTGRGIRNRQSRLAFVSRYNQSSLDLNGIHLPKCYVSPVSSTQQTETVPASSSCLSWELRRVWRVDLEKCIDASPLVVQRRDHEGAVCSTWAIVGSHSAQLVCVDVLAAGREVWRVTLDDRIEACAALSVKYEIAYVGTYAGSLFALSFQSGVTRWRFQAKGTIKASALVMDKQRLVVCGAYDNHLHGLDAVTGQQRWAIDLEGSIFSTLLYCAWSGQLFAATTNGAVVALRSPSDFNCVKEQWKLQLPAPVFAGLNADYTSKMLTVGCADGQLYGVSTDSGDIQWQVRTEKPIFSSPCVSRPGSVVFGSHDGILRKVNCRSGQLAWTTDLHSAVFASPTVVRLLVASPTRRTHNQRDTSGDDRLLCCVTTTAGRLYFCDESTGSIVYQTCESTGKAMSAVTSDQCSDDLGPLFGSPVLLDNWCLLGTRANHFYGFELVSRNSAATLVRPDGNFTGS